MDGSVSSWLEAIHLQEYVPLLNNLGYDTVNKCASIKSKDALKGMGVTKVGHLNRLYRAIEKLRGEDSSSSLTLPANISLSDYNSANKSKSMTILPAKVPPPVPIRRTATLRSSRSPTPEVEVKPVPPPVMPRSKSLRRAPSNTTSSIRKGHSDSTPGSLSAIPQSPMTTEPAPIFPVAPKAPPRTTPVAKPRTTIPTHRTSSDERPLSPIQNTPPTPAEIPPIPPKKAHNILPQDSADVVFELEDIPMPSPTSTGFVGPAPVVPTRNSGPPSFAPPPPPPERKYFKTPDVCSLPLTEEPAVPNEPTSPADPVSTNGPVSVSTSEQIFPTTVEEPPVPNFSPPPLPERDPPVAPITPPLPDKDLPLEPVTPPLPVRPPSPRAMLITPPLPVRPPSPRAMLITPPLPDKEPVLVPVTPPLPTESSTSPLGETPSPSASPEVLVEELPSATAPLPSITPRHTETPPPNLTVTQPGHHLQSPNDSCYSDSESEDDRPLISIRSSLPTNNQQLGWSHDMSDSGSESEYDSPARQVIKQQLTGLKSGANAVENDSRMIISTLPRDAVEGDDYMNQEVIDQVIENDEDREEVTVGPPLTITGRGSLSNDLHLSVSNGHEQPDYMNSELLDNVYDEDDHCLLEGTKISIKSGSLKSREKNLTPEIDPDYINQEVLDEDIIPFVTLTGTQPEGTMTNFNPSYLNSDPVNKSSIYDTLPPQQTSPANLADDSHSLSPSNRDSIVSTFPRTKSDAAFARAYGGPNSSQNTTPSSMESSIEESPKTGTDLFDGGHLIRTAGTFAGGDVQFRRPDYRRVQSDALSKCLDSRQSAIYASTTRHGSETFYDVPKSKEGFLFKKGGRRSEKPWQKRWMTFNGSELKYFRHQGDKDKSSRNIVPLQEMIDIKKVPDDDKTYRFDLVVINRVFQFSAASSDERQTWIDVLHAAIAKFKPQEHEVKEGGNMHNPDKQGFLEKQGRGLGKAFKERYVALKGSKFAYYETKEDFVQGRPIHILEMSLSSVRPDMTSKLPRFIIIMSSMKQYVFQASSTLERKEWLDTMTTAILEALDKRPQTISRSGNNTTSQDILAQVQANVSNKVCADCCADDPSWGVINKGIMVCINCSGVHRALGTHISKVRSIELDRQIWKTNLIKLMVDIGNENSNGFWERHYTGGRLPADVERDIRENFIRAKYEIKSWIPRPTGESQSALNKLLCVAAKTSNLMRTIELLAHGAQASSGDGESESPLSISRESNQLTQVELLEQNGGLITRSQSTQPEAPVSKKGHLHKTGSDRSGWRKRFCSLDKFRGFEYFKTEGDAEALGYIHINEMLSVSRFDDDTTRDPRYKYCFEVNTQGRGYLFCADTESDLASWVKVFEQVIPHDAADNLGFDKVGYLKKKEHVGGFKKKWFTLKGKSLSSYRREREEVDEIDLRKVTELKGPDPGGNLEQQCTFTIFMADKSYLLRAESPADAESWLSALRHTQVSGIPLGEQQLTSTGIPILVHKCLQFVESYGMETEGLYRLSGGKAQSRKLVLAFNQDARGVVIDPEVFTVHDVTGTLKQFFRSLPDPLLTHRLYQSFVNTMQADHESQMYQMQSLIEQLPPVNRETLRRVAGHLKKVGEFHTKNKMSLSNLVRVFAPTLMTVDGDPVSFENTQYEYSCVDAMIRHYKWLFQVDEDEARKEEAIEAAMKKIKQADQLQGKTSTISSSMDFLTRIYIGAKDGDSYGINITGTSMVSDVVEKVATDKALPPNNYALYLVLGDSESHRVLSFNERLLAVLCSTGTDCFLCLKPNTFGDTLKQYIDYVRESEPVVLKVRGKKTWKPYPCTVRNDHFIQFKDPKCHQELFKISVHDLDVFAGIEGSKLDVKNPLPTRYCFWLKAMRGEDKCRYLCADKEEDMLKIFAWIVKAKYPDQLQTPLLPTRPPPPTQPPLLDLRAEGSPFIQRNQELRDYANVKVSGKR